jgi:perosamine synthetase
MKFMQLGNTEKRVIASMKPYFPEEDIREMTAGFEKILRSGRLTLGGYTLEFEKQFANYVGTRFAIAANSGTSTLEMIYRSIGIEGKEVITPTNTHIATSNAVMFAGGNPILADIEAETLCIDVEDAFSKVNKNTKALVVVHLAGLIHPKIDEIRKRCEEERLVLIEDAAHAHGATIDGRKAGSLGHAASFSFYPAKVVTAIEGGMVTTDDPNISDVSRELRNHGSDTSGLQVRLGYNWRMSEVHSLVGLTQLKRIEEIVTNKNKIASTYIKELEDVRGVRTVHVPRNIRHSYYKFPVSLDRGFNVKQIQDSLKLKFGIESGSIYYPPCHLQPIYKKLFPNLAGTMPVSEDILARTIALPIQAGMSIDDAVFVAGCLKEVLHSLS